MLCPHACARSSAGLERLEPRHVLQVQQRPTVHALEAAGAEALSSSLSE